MSAPAGNNENRIPDWLDTGPYPFTVLEFNTGRGMMSYVDQGAGEPMLFVHGTPVWSFLYRELILEFSNTNRCIAPDHLGFGLSDKKLNFKATPKEHAQNLNALIRDLDLKDITLVVHDFGGPIGLGSLIDESERIKRVVLFNTWCWATDQDKNARRVDKAVNSWLGRFLYLRLNFSVKVLLKKAFADKSNLTYEVFKHYQGPFPTASTRRVLLDTAQSLVGSSDWFGKLHDKLSVFANKPVQIIWGMHDDFITPEQLERWKGIFPQANVSQLQCGHFVQEECPGESARTIRDFLNANQ